MSTIDPLNPLEPVFGIPNVVTSPSSGNDTGSGSAPAGANPAIIYNGGVTLDIPVFPYRWQVHPEPFRNVSMTVNGVGSSVLYPRMDIPVSGGFNLMRDATLRALLNSWWQWAMKGNTWAITLDKSRMVNTALASQGIANVSSSLQIEDLTGVRIGGIYKLISAQYYELVTVTNINTSTGTVFFAEPIMGFYPIRSIFRDQNLYPGVIRSADAPNPVVDCIADQYQPMPQTSFWLELEFHETVS